MPIIPSVELIENLKAVIPASFIWPCKILFGTVTTFVRLLNALLVPDLIGFGKSDKPKDRNSYTYKSHVTWLTSFLNQLKIKNSALFGQDWGGLIGLRILVESPKIFNNLLNSLNMNS